MPLVQDAGAQPVGGSADVAFTNLTQFLEALQDVDLLGGVLLTGCLVPVV